MSGVISVPVEVSRKDVVKVMQELRKLETSTPNNIKNAINRTATKVRRMMVQGMKGAYTLKEGFKAGTLDLFRASPGVLVATIKSEGPTRQTKEFQYSDGGAGVSAAVRKGGGKLVKGDEEAGPAFIATGGKIAGMIAQRRGKGRTPVRVLHSNSIPKMAEMSWQGKAAGPDLEPLARRALYEEISAEIAKLTGGGR